MDLFEQEFSNLAPKSVINNGETQLSYTIVKYSDVTYANAKLALQGVVTSTYDGTMASLAPTAGLFKDSSTAPTLGVASTTEMYNWFNGISTLSKTYAGVSGTSIATQVAFTPGVDGKLVAIVNNNASKGGGVTTSYNNSVGFAFDNSIVPSATVALLPTQVVTNCLGGNTVMLVGAPISPIAC